MPDMREPYAYVVAAADRMESKAKHARHRASCLMSEADALEESAIQLRVAIHQQKDADKEAPDA